MKVKLLSNRPVAWGIIATILVLLLCLLAFYDNPDGFRHAEALASLLSAAFSGVATVWLIVTVIRQGEELRLQREELRLQREETTRLADEAHRQSESMLNSSQIQTRRSLQQLVQNLININEGSMRNIYKKLEKIAFQIAAPDKAHYLVNGGGGDANFSVSGAICEIILSAGAGGHETSTECVEWNRILEIFEKNDISHYWSDFWNAICDCARNAINENLADFWRDILVISISPNAIELTKEVKAVLLAAYFSCAPGELKNIPE